MLPRLDAADDLDLEALADLTEAFDDVFVKALVDALADTDASLSSGGAGRSSLSSACQIEISNAFRLGPAFRSEHSACTDRGDMWA